MNYHLKLIVQNLNLSQNSNSFASIRMEKEFIRVKVLLTLFVIILMRLVLTNMLLEPQTITNVQCQKKL